LAGLEGSAYYRLPLYSEKGYHRFEIDGVVLLRDYGAFLFEVKGCKIGHISSIDGNAWTMTDWCQPTEAPCAQVDQQKFAFRGLLESVGLADSPCVERVVLPFIGAEEWSAAGYAGLTTTRIVWTKEDLEPDRLRAWLASVPRRRRFSDREWAELLSRFGTEGSSTDSSAPAAPVAPAPANNTEVQFLEFDGDPLSNEQILDLIPGLSDEAVGYSYIVATGALERLRANEFRPELQLVEPDDDEFAKPVLVFHKVLRHMVRQPNLRRFEERTLLLRAVRELAADPTRRALLEQDVLAWRDALVELDEAGIDLGGGVPAELSSRLVRDDLGDILRELQLGFREQMRRHGAARNFEWVGREYLDTAFRPTELVILEGFSRFTPLQEHFVRRCVRLGAQVVIIRPHRPEQQYGFEAVRTAHSAATAGLGHAIRTKPTGFSTRGDLGWLQQNLFSESPSAAPADRDGSVVLEAWPHRNLEVQSAVKRVKAALREGCAAHDVVLAVRDPDTYVPLILEEAELQDTQSLFRIPPRLLLLTPVGRFALGLYAAWEDGLHLDPESLETFLASGLLGARAQQTADMFRAVKPQLFAQCISESDWRGRLGDLRRLREGLPSDSRLPAAGVPLEVADLWQAVIERLGEICSRLAQAESRPVGTHIQLLLDELSRLDDAGMRGAERAVLDQIREVLAESTESASIELSPHEFGRVLLGMSQEREEFASEDPQRVSVLGVESLDGVRKRFVVALGVDDARVPRTPSESWPLEDPEFDKQLQQERYLFLALVRSAAERLVLSYARTDGPDVRHPSMYLAECAEQLGGILAGDPYGGPVGEASSPREPARCRRLGRARREHYAMGELARFKLCPHRYKLERIAPSSRRHDTDFQLVFAAQGHWLRLALDWLAESGHSAPPSPEPATRWFDEALAETRVRALQDFPALRAADHAAIEQSLMQNRDHLVSRFANGQYDISIERVRMKALELVIDERPVTVSTPIRHALRVGRLLHPELRAPTSLDWLIDGTKTDRDEEHEVETESAEDLEVLVHQYDAVTWWRDAIKAVFYAQHGTGQTFLDQKRQDLSRLREELAALIRRIEEGVYPKNPGEHCKYCPACSTCLGKRP